MLNDPGLALMKDQSFPELASALRAKSSTILNRLHEAVRTTLPDADELTFNELRDQLPQSLERMAVALAAVGGPSTDRFVRGSAEHGISRFHQSFNLEELLLEYSLFRAILIEEVTIGLGRAIHPDELAALNAGVDASSRQAVLAFVQNQSAKVAAAAESRGKYVSFMSHDLRGALNGLLLMLEMLKRDLAAAGKFADSIESIDLMKHSILETVGLTDRFLQAERFHSGKVDVRLQPINMATVIGAAIDQARLAARGKGLTIESDVSRCSQVTTDRELVTAILQNALSNAVKYSKAGTIRIVTEPLDGDGCRISVSDQGPGIPHDKLESLFAPFVRGDTHGQPGTGLGLSIARQAADVLGARLWATSEVGAGTTLNLDLPGA
jgi:signal transduction histidine kinase